jgi:tellurite resistance protein TerA
MAEPTSGKVTLTKSAPTVSLSKSAAAGGVMRVNLNWTARPAGAPSGGFLKKLLGGSDSAAIDLDLACLYELSNGDKGVVQALGNSFASDPGPKPVIRLDGDDRSGTNTEGENLFIDLSQLALVRRVVVFAFIYEGVANWGAADAVVTLHPQEGPPVEVRLDEHAANASMCAVALLENSGGELVVRREVRYVSKGHKELDSAYGWGLNWTAGRK